LVVGFQVTLNGRPAGTIWLSPGVWKELPVSAEVGVVHADAMPARAADTKAQNEVRISEDCGYFHLEYLRIYVYVRSNIIKVLGR